MSLNLHSSGLEINSESEVRQADNSPARVKQTHVSPARWCSRNSLQGQLLVYANSSYLGTKGTHVRCSCKSNMFAGSCDTHCF